MALNQDGASQLRLRKHIEPSLWICQLNKEGISRAKVETLSKHIENKMDVIATQETHTALEAELLKRWKIPRSGQIGAIYSTVYDTATSVKNGIENSNLIGCTSDEDLTTDNMVIGNNGYWKHLQTTSNPMTRKYHWLNQTGWHMKGAGYVHPHNPAEG